MIKVTTNCDSVIFKKTEFWNMDTTRVYGKWEEEADMQHYINIENGDIVVSFTTNLNTNHNFNTNLNIWHIKSSLIYCFKVLDSCEKSSNELKEGLTI